MRYATQVRHFAASNMTPLKAVCYVGASIASGRGVVAVRIHTAKIMISPFLRTLGLRIHVRNLLLSGCLRALNFAEAVVLFKTVSS
jgi:hypothetical protein